jgi:hypothetical protein
MMNAKQRATAERLIERLIAELLMPGSTCAEQEAADLLREFLAEQWLTSAKLDACMASRDALRDWAQECRDQVLYLLAQRDDELGRLADGFGQASVALLRELLSEPVINQQMTTELAEPVQEPVIAVVTTSNDYGATIDWTLNPLPTGTELFTHPPQQRRPLTDKEIIALSAWDDYMGGCITLLDFARAIEHAHGITGELT